MHPRITAVRPIRPYVVELDFTDGSHGVVDLSQWIVESRGVFASLRDPEFFAQVAVDEDAGTIVWPNGADLDPDVLYEAAHAASARAEDG